MRKPTSAVAFLTLLAILAPEARAASLTLTYDFTNFDAVPLIPLFHESGEIRLTEVDVTGSGSTTWTVGVDPGLLSLTYRVNTDMLFSNGVDLGMSTEDRSATYSAPRTTVTLSNTWSLDDQFTTGLKAWTGSGTYFSCGSQIYDILTSDPQIGSSLDQSVFGTFHFTVTYQFTVPEPSSAVLGGTAIMVWLAVWLSVHRRHR